MFPAHHRYLCMCKQGEKGIIFLLLPDCAVQSQQEYEEWELRRKVVKIGESWTQAQSDFHPLFVRDNKRLKKIWFGLVGGIDEFSGGAGG